jgi:hypothetical protein
VRSRPILQGWIEWDEKHASKTAILYKNDALFLSLLDVGLQQMLDAVVET